MQQTFKKKIETHFVLCYNKHRMRGSCPPLHFKFKGFTHYGIFTVRCAFDLISRHSSQAVCHEKMRYVGSTMTANIGKKLYAFYVTDEALLEKTGGIVQGMSGSPIIQNGKLIGAITHVLIGNPTTGYGIFIENMLAQAGGLAS